MGKPKGHLATNWLTAEATFIHVSFLAGAVSARLFKAFGMTHASRCFWAPTSNWHPLNTKHDPVLGRTRTRYLHWFVRRTYTVDWLQHFQSQKVFFQKLWKLLKLPINSKPSLFLVRVLADTELHLLKPVWKLVCMQTKGLFRLSLAYSMI